MSIEDGTYLISNRWGRRSALSNIRKIGDRYCVCSTTKTDLKGEGPCKIELRNKVNAGGPNPNCFIAKKADGSGHPSCKSQTQEEILNQMNRTSVNYHGVLCPQVKAVPIRVPVKIPIRPSSAESYFPIAGLSNRHPPPGLVNEQRLRTNDLILQKLAAAKAMVELRRSRSRRSGLQLFHRRHKSAFRFRKRKGKKSRRRGKSRRRKKKCSVRRRKRKSRKRSRIKNNSKRGVKRR